MTVKEKLKKSNLIRSYYTKSKNRLVKLSPVLATKFLYKKKTGKKLNLNKPRDFNEKLQWLKLYWQHPLVVQCGDKYEVRNYAKDLGCPEILTEIYGIYNSVEELEWQTLPQKFALKVTNGCGFNIICENKSKLDKENTLNQLKNWLNTDFSLKNAELHYSKMKPRIICEKFIETNEGQLPVDYKIYCFNGNPEIILVTPERETGFKRFIFDLDWNILNFEKGSTISKSELPNEPRSLKRMIDYSRKLSKPFPFVRVDFYDYNDKPILGEMTFTPAAGMATHYTDDALIEMGDMINLPEKIYNK
ncbi:hypothetical protein CIL05_00040 [Virgibacillus profundi]|uniref:Glycosyl transferase n=1 Tax=Virgibacillus profundi TaxID=2024555 RepID=A0A2A2IIE9_9BACI|nr:ATP-grasp fold amidoligase family protein [Virgibacillus profundi]PAV31086.1 hypothetical protein CIL05_00040 [Virgibacillus profundi]PXY55269.1 hypothetical protein CIT14_00040 [Virgibacillus profundi]